MMRFLLSMNLVARVSVFASNTFKVPSSDLTTSSCIKFCGSHTAYSNADEEQIMPSWSPCGNPDTINFGH